MHPGPTLRAVVPLWALFTGLKLACALLVVHVLPFSPEAADTSTDLFSVLPRWDGDFFMGLAHEGYLLEAHPLSAAFFPTFPLAVRLLSLPLAPLVSESTALHASAFVLTSICSCAAALLLYRITLDRFDRRVAAWAVVVLMVWPSAAFLTTFYSEGLYLVCALGAWLLATRQRWVLCGALCGVASFVRINGVFLCLALVVMYVVMVARGQEKLRAADLGGILLGLTGAGLYFAFLTLQTGDPLFWFHIQDVGWGRRTVSPWSSLTTTWSLLTGDVKNAADRWQLAADLVMTAVSLVLALVMAARRYWPELTLTALTFGSLVSSTYYLSVTRSTLTVFPLVIVAASLLARWRPARSLVVISASTAWMFSVMTAFSLQFWAG